MKTAIVTDSNSGITQIEAKELGITVVPMPALIDGDVYYEDLTLTQSQFYEKLEGDAQVSTFRCRVVCPKPATPFSISLKRKKDLKIKFLL